MTGPRGCYWVPGMNSAVEPWTALAECNTGHLIVPCGRNTDYARWVVEHWRELTSAGLLVDPYRTCVGGGVVDPAGAVVHSWGSVPVPGKPRWTALWRLRDPATCQRCGAARWPGCWTAARDPHGCSRCLPPAETADPRRWPLECAPPIRATPTTTTTTEGNPLDDDDEEL